MRTRPPYQRYQELQSYVGWSDDDAARVASVAQVLFPILPALIDDFYAEIARHPDAQRVITEGPEQIARLKTTLLGWLRDLLTGPYDADYVDRRWRVGLRHVEIGLNQVYTNAALTRLRRGLDAALAEGLQDDLQRLFAVRTSVMTLIDLDLAIIEDAYQSEYTARQQAQERQLQSERLAAIGQMMAGLAHESRNALQRSQACLEMLKLEVHELPAALDLVGRIQNAQDHLHQLYEEVRDYASPIRLKREAHDLEAILRETWDHLLTQRNGREARLEVDAADARPVCLVDRFAVEQVFRNVLENSLSACADPVHISAGLRASVLGRGQAIELSLADNGPGLSAEARSRIFEPFYTTKTRGTGLGMAIARRIVEAHGGQIAVGDRGGPGAEILIMLPVQEPEGTSG
jgi:signal transduction histidine kinase